MSKAVINIIGACTSRDIFGITNKDRDDPESYKIQSYIWNISPFYLFDKNFYIDDLKFIKYREKYKSEMRTNISDFCALRTLLSLKKNIFEITDFENCDNLIIDNFFCQLKYYELEDKTIITRTDDNLLNFLISNKAVPKIINKFEFNDISIALKKEMIKKFCLKIKEYIDESKIIIIEYRPANIIFNKNYDHFGIFSNSKAYKNNLNKFKWTAQILKENLMNATYIAPPAVTISDYNHKWSQHLLHYLPDYYYHYYIPIIDLQTRNTSTSKDNTENNKYLHSQKHINIKNIKINFDKHIIDKYGPKIIKNNIHDFKKLYLNNKIYEIYSFHNTKIFLNTENKSIVNSKTINALFYPIYVKIDHDKIMLYIIINNKIFYINEITFFAKANLSENQTWLNSIIYNNNNTISFKLYDKFLSFRANGESCFMPWNREWEHISLHEI